jgi:tetratricopeptide (TPR) repeat protein
MRMLQTSAVVVAAFATAAMAWAAQSDLEAAESLVMDHRYDEAMAAVDRYLDRHPKDPAANLVKSRICTALGEWDRSVDALEDALSEHGDNVDLLLALAITYREKMRRSGIFGKMSNAKKSRQFVEKAFATDPSHLPTRRQMVMYLVYAPGFAGGDKERAEKLALETVEMDETEGSFQLGVVYWKRGNEAASDERFRRALELDPANVDAMLEWGGSLIERKRYDEAGDLFVDFIARRPDRPEPYGALGDCYKEQGMVDEAIARYLSALERDEWYGYARYNVARLYDKKRDKQQAAYHYRELLERNPGYIDAGTAKKQLRKIEKGR